MENKENIDELIRQGMEDFHPQAPDDVWQGIEQQLQTPNAPGANSLMQKVMEWSWQVKLAASVLVPATLTGLYLLVQTEPKTTPNPKAETSLPYEQKGLEAKVEASIEELPVINAPEKKKEPKVEKTSKPTKEMEPIINNTTPEKPIESQPIVGATISEPKPKEKIEGVKKQTKEPPILPTYKPEGISEPTAKTQRHNDPEFGNFFSPNGDGSNDVWEIRIEPTVFYHLKIVNVRGQLVFETDQAGNFWNGIDYKTGVECENGTYSYIFDYQFDKNEPLQSKRGFINLLR